MDYLDFSIELTAVGEATYAVRAETPFLDASIRRVFTMPYDEARLEAVLDKVELAVSRGSGRRRTMQAPDTEVLQEFGTRLFEALLTEDIAGAYHEAYRRADEQSKGLRLRLNIDAPDLAPLPWELLYNPRRDDFMCLSPKTPVVRHLPSGAPMPSLEVPAPLRILTMITSPGGLYQLDVQNERNRIVSALAPLRDRGIVELGLVDGGTWRDLQSAMRNGPWHVFHFIGHGTFDQSLGEGVLAFESEDGSSYRTIRPVELSRIIESDRFLRLVVLNACEGARGDEKDVFSSMASYLAKRSAPAVLAMQWEISDEAAIEFSRTFYEALGAGRPVDEAVGEARLAISLAAIANSVEWATPVLHMRSMEGVLFDVTDVPASSPDHEEPAKDARDDAKALHVPSVPGTAGQRAPPDEESVASKAAPRTDSDAADVDPRLPQLPDPPRRRWLWPAAVVALLALVIVVLVLSVLPPDRVTVPDVLNDADPVATLEALGLVPTISPPAYSADVPADDLISQDPAGGTEVDPGSSVKLVFSLGPEPGLTVTVPDVLNDADPVATLEALGLVPTISPPAYSADVPADDLISQDPAGGTEVDPGSSVKLVFSLGPEPAELPSGSLTIDSISPVSPAQLQHGDRVEFTISYSTDAANGVRIFGRPLTGSSLTPGYGAHGSQVHPSGSGEATGFFTIDSGQAIVDAIRVQMIDAESEELVAEITVDVDYAFSAEPPPLRIVDLFPSSPATLRNGDRVEFTISYSTDAANGVRIFGRPLTGSSLTPGYGAHGSQVHPSGSGEATGFFTIDSGQAIVDAIRVQMIDAESEELIAELTVLVSYAFAP